MFEEPQRHSPTYPPSPHHWTCQELGSTLPAQIQTTVTGVGTRVSSCKPFSSCSLDAIRITSKGSCISPQHPAKQRAFLSPVTLGPELSLAQEKVTYMSSSSHKAAEEDLTTQLCTNQNPCNILVIKPETAMQLIPTHLLLTPGNATTVASQVSVKLFQAKLQPQ